MRFDLSDDQLMARDVTRAFLAAEWPLAAVRRRVDDADAFDRDLWKRVAELGWTSLLVPETNGGTSLSDEPVVDLTLIAAEVGRAVAPGPLLETNVVADALVRSDNIALRDLHLGGLLAGTTVAGWCVDHAAWFRRRPGGVTAVRRADGGAVLDGSVLAAAPLTTDVVLVTTPALTCLVATAAPGVTLAPLEWLDPSTRHARVSFDAVAVSPEQIVSDRDDEFERQSRLAWVLQAAELTGILDAVFALTLEWLANRHSFGRPLASYQALKHRCADMKLWLEATHAIADAAATAVAADAPDAGALARAAKAYAAPHALELIQDCTQMHGGIGVTWEHNLHLFLRRATVIAASYGTATDLFEDLAAAQLDGGEAA